jgi:chitinase
MHWLLGTTRCLCLSPSSSGTSEPASTAFKGVDLANRNANGSVCLSTEQTKATIQFAQLHVKATNETSDGIGRAESADLVVPLQEVQKLFGKSAYCDVTVMFGYYRRAFVGVCIGLAIDNAATASSVIQMLNDQVNSQSTSTSLLVQLCGHGRTSDHVFGVVADMTRDIDSVQNAVKSWNEGLCVDVRDSTSASRDVNIWETALSPLQNESSTGNWSLSTRRIHAQDGCKTITANSGDGCSSLASRCGITQVLFTSYNPGPSLCNIIQVGQTVCCSAGRMAVPQANANGTCATYFTQSGDNCGKIASANGLTTTALDHFNNGTMWGWNGCGPGLPAGINMCTSKGNPPMLAPLSNAVCGPLVTGTLPPTGTQSLTMLNPCPLNACCDIYGQCGTDDTFCDSTKGPSGNPGSAPLYKAGCISNCGSSIVNNDAAPAQNMSVGYYEGWNWDRPYLHMWAVNIDNTSYSHVHWGFGTITSNFSVFINDTYNQFPDFLGLMGSKRILLIGGWGFSTGPSTYDLFRQVTNPTNRDTFAKNVVDFLTENKLDRVDFDWEYPGVSKSERSLLVRRVKRQCLTTDRLPIFPVFHPVRKLMACTTFSSSPYSRSYCHPA